MSFQVRKTTKDDIPAIMGMIQELADFEKMSNGPKLKLEDLQRDGGFDGGNPMFKSFVAVEVLSCKIVGFALSFFTYSTWEGRSLFLEDLYVKPDYRKKGVGKMLFVEAVKFAKENDCKRFDLHVLDWNPARAFYNKMGATDLTETEGWHYVRLDSKAIAAISN